MEQPSDAALLCGVDMDQGKALSLAGGSAVVLTRRRPGREGGNEDGAALIPFDAERAVLAVADGVGGGPDGARAVTLALRALRDALVDAARDGDELRTAVLNGFERANQKILASAVGATTTLVVAALEDGCVRPIHCGDSELLVTGQRGRVKLQTVSHSPTGYAVEAGLLDEEEALHHEERHVISNAVGTEDMRIEVGAPLRLAPRDTVVLGSDGLFDNLSGEEIVACARAGPLEGALAALVAEAERRMATPRAGEPSKPDDLTVVLFRPGARGRRPGPPAQSR
jgi:serine/threonine protein phosphatase PrpC